MCCACGEIIEVPNELTVPSRIPPISEFVQLVFSLQGLNVQLYVCRTAVLLVVKYCALTHCGVLFQGHNVSSAFFLCCIFLLGMSKDRLQHAVLLFLQGLCTSFVQMYVLRHVVS